MQSRILYRSTPLAIFATKIIRVTVVRPTKHAKVVRALVFRLVCWLETVSVFFAAGGTCTPRVAGDSCAIASDCNAGGTLVCNDWNRKCWRVKLLKGRVVPESNVEIVFVVFVVLGAAPKCCPTSCLECQTCTGVTCQYVCSSLNGYEDR
jgi:hypothetical protein